MYILICGAGLVGISLAQKLVELGHTVGIIDIDPNACRYAREQIGVMAFEGSAVSTEVLLEAGIRKANALAAVLRSDHKFSVDCGILILLNRFACLGLVISLVP